MIKNSDRIYAIGDIHGRADLLRALLAKLSAETEDHAIIFLGDLIDRGPESCAVLDIVAEQLRLNDRSSLILGNHDWFLREFLLDRLGAEDLERWVEKYGALGAMASYGVTDPASDWNATRRHILEAWPGHLELLRSARHYVVAGSLCFVHAGVRPGIALAEQAADDLMWIKAEFLECRQPFEYLVIHGHTPTPSGLPEIHPNRIAIDTHAFKSGHLSAAAFDGGRFSYFVWTRLSEEGDIAVERVSSPG